MEAGCQSVFLDETSEHPLLRPIAIEGETILGCLGFLPISTILIVGAALARSMVDGVRCAYSEGSCFSANGVPVSPTGFGIAASQLPPDELGASSITPWVGATGYSDATGWDSPRHYDILAAGGLPYVVDLDICPRYSLHALPKALLERVRSLPHLPPAARIRADAVASMNVALASNGTAPRSPRRAARGLPGAAAGRASSLRLRWWAGEQPTADELHELEAVRARLLWHAREHVTSVARARFILSRTLGTEALAEPLQQLLRRQGANGTHNGGGRSSSSSSTTTSKSSRSSSKSKSGVRSADGGSGDGMRAGSDPKGPRVLMLTVGSTHDPQLTMLHAGLQSLGVTVDERRDRRPTRHRPRSQRERTAAAAELSKQRQRLAANHASLPYHLIVVQLHGDSTDEYHGGLVGGLVPRGTERPRVACICTEARPRVVWQVWAPTFCDRVFVRDMRLWP